jgi:hypothetical protein
VSGTGLSVSGVPRLKSLAAPFFSGNRRAFVQHNAALDGLFQSLLHDLTTGKVRVNGLEWKGKEDDGNET